MNSNALKTLLTLAASVLLVSTCAKDSESPLCDCPDIPEQKDCPACNCPAPNECPACNCNCPQQGPTLLANYEEVMAALKAGKKVRGVFDYHQCILNDDGPGPGAIGGMGFEVWEWFDRLVIGNPDAYVVSSENKFIYTFIGSSGKYEHVYNYGKVKITEQNKVTVFSQYVRPNTLEVAMQETHACDMTTNAAAPLGATFYAE